MTKWKSVVVVVLLASLAGYGFYTNIPHTAANVPPPPPLGKDGKPMPSPLDKLVGKPAIAWRIPPSFWVNTPQPIVLSELVGHPTLIEFWRAGCSHCQEAAPFMSALYKHYHPLGLNMVTFQSPTGPTDDRAEEANWNNVKDTIRKWQLPYPVAFDKDGVLFTKAYGGTTYPTVLVLNEAGIIKFAQSGHDALKEKKIIAAIDAALHKTPRAAKAPPQQPKPLGVR